jgi:hypothetical protein
MKRVEKIDIPILSLDCTEACYNFPDKDTRGDTENHLDLEISEQNNYTAMSFSSRLTMLTFARELMSYALFEDSCNIEFLPFDEHIGMNHYVKMKNEKARLFIFCNNENQINENDWGISSIPPPNSYDLKK